MPITTEHPVGKESQLSSRMPHYLTFSFLVIVLRFVVTTAIVLCEPEQIRLSASGDPTEMMLTWTTFNDTKSSIVEYGINSKLTETAFGESSIFIDGGSEHRVQYIHRVKLVNLEPGEVYTYHCGSKQGWSALFTFKALQRGSNWGPRFAVYGDMGDENPQSLSQLQEETQKGYYDSILHVGDFAYDFNFENGSVGDAFMRSIESIAAYVPYMTCPGNHEHAYNFSHYKNRFTMPDFDKVQNLWYSWNIGPAHIVSFSTEVYFFLEYGLDLIRNQREWLIADLEEANKPENRQLRPWIITMGHRPIYCTNIKPTKNCDFYSQMLQGAFEDIFYKNGVDLSFWAHEHSYERFWPVYRNKVYNGSVDEPYTNPKAPVHVVVGSAGCWEEKSVFGPSKPYDAFRTNDYGYTRMHIFNSSHIHLEQVSVDKGGSVIDQITIKKDKHGPEAWV